MDTYCVSFEGKDVGSVTVSREGLYYNFSCKVTSWSGGMYRLLLKTELETIDLGILVPQGNTFVLSKRLPIKQIRGKRFSFAVITAVMEKNEKYISVTQDQPFSYIEELLNTKLETKAGNNVIVLSNN